MSSRPEQEEPIEEIEEGEIMSEEEDIDDEEIILSDDEYEINDDDDEDNMDIAGLMTSLLAPRWRYCVLRHSQSLFPT